MEQQRIAAAQRGEAEATAWVVETWTPVAWRYALRLLGNEQDARDAAQDTMVKVLRNIGRYDPRWRFTTWVLGICRNTCIDEFRRRRWTADVPDLPEPADPRPNAAEQSERQRTAAEVQAALLDIPPLYRDILVLYHYEHLKYQEIADLLQIPLGTVMNRIFRARARLRTALEARASGSPA